MNRILKNCGVNFERRDSEDRKVNAKSIMGMMSLGLASGEEVTVVADGNDEDTAVVEIEKFLSGN